MFTELARHPEDLQAVTGRLGLHPRSARDFLDTLVAMGFVERREGKYSNTQAADFFLDKRKPLSLVACLRWLTFACIPSGTTSQRPCGPEGSK